MSTHSVRLVRDEGISCRCGQSSSGVGGVELVMEFSCDDAVDHRKPNWSPQDCPKSFDASIEASCWSSWATTPGSHEPSSRVVTCVAAPLHGSQTVVEPIEVIDSPVRGREDGHLEGTEVGVDRLSSDALAVGYDPPYGDAKITSRPPRCLDRIKHCVRSGMKRCPGHTRASTPAGRPLNDSFHTDEVDCCRAPSPSPTVTTGPALAGSCGGRRCSPDTWGINRERTRLPPTGMATW